MKKLLALLLASIMVFLLFGCSSNDDDDKDKKTNDKGSVTLSRGEVDDDVYVNDFLGFTFNKPSSWVFYTDEQIASAVQSSSSLLKVDLEEALEKSGSVFDMMVVDSVTNSNINVGYENLSKTLSKDTTVEQYIDALKSQLSSMTYMTVDFPDEYDTVKLGDSEFTRVVCHTSTYGVEMTQIYYLRKVDKYMCFVIATITSGYSVSSIEAMFE